MKKKPELKKGASVLEIEAYEESLKGYENQLNRPAFVSMFLGIGIFLLGAGYILFFLWMPIQYFRNMIGYEGWFYVFNIFRMVCAYGVLVAFYIAAFKVLGIVKGTVECDDDHQKFRLVSRIFCYAGMVLMAVGFVLVTVQICSYWKDFYKYSTIIKRNG